MLLYDTRRRTAVAITPLRRGYLSVYACGPTVYRDAHVGNMRTFLLTDLIRRTAALEGLRTIIVQNITDVGHMADDTGLGGADEGLQGGQDRVIGQAEAEGRSALQVARRYEQRFHSDLSALNIHPADHYPRASESIDLMIALIGTLIDSGHAYIGDDGSVFFDARSFVGYGDLSGNLLDDLRPGHRFHGTVDPAKRFHADWVLWKRAPDTRTQLVWDTPWGRGFPGWHTECSAMSLDLLGPAIDIHIGGIDLRFPHHEDERAQSNCATGREVVTTWVHGEHLLFEGRKMSKSAGNVVLVSDVVAQGLDPLALRLAFLQHRYRQQMNLTWEGLVAADATIGRWRERLAQWSTSPSAPMPRERVRLLEDCFRADLDTPRAVSGLRELEKDATVSAGSKFEAFAHLDRLLGLDLAREVGSRPPKHLDPVPDDVRAMLDRRVEARARRDWRSSDELRDQLAEMGYPIVDTPDGQRFAR